MTSASGPDVPAVDTNTYEYVNEFSENPPQTQFRFKTKNNNDTSVLPEPAHLQRDRRKRHRTDSESSSPSHRRHHHHHHHRHRTSDRTTASHPSTPRKSPELDPDVAFRESLFDAMADDEGAAFWEGVYGQPIHTYARETLSPAGDSLNRMSDEEYVSYVRSRMWAKTHEAVLEERNRRQEELKRKKTAEEQWRRDGARFETEREKLAKDVEASLRKGAARREEKAWADAWSRYVRGWEELAGLHASVPEKHSEGGPTARIPWPVRSGKSQDTTSTEIENFFRHAGGDDKLALRELLKKERVRWHPDKMQQRFGARGGLDSATVKAITAVFQIIDALWAKTSA